MNESCAWCGRPLPLLAREHGDEFCSVTCCKTSHGVLDQPTLRNRGRVQDRINRTTKGVESPVERLLRAIRQE